MRAGMGAHVDQDARIRSLLDINRTFAKENTFLSQQFELMSRECASLTHMLRSKMALSNAREMELRSSLEGMRISLQGKQELVKRLEKRIKELEEQPRESVRGDKHEQRNGSHTKGGVMGEDDECTDVPGTAIHTSCYVIDTHGYDRGDAKTKTDDDDGRRGSGSQRRTATTPSSTRSSRDSMACLEANHPWLSPMLLRLDKLSAEGDRVFKMPSHKRLSPSEDDGSGPPIDLTAQEEEAVDPRDAESWTDDPYETPDQVRCRLSLPSLNDITGEKLDGRERACAAGSGGHLVGPCEEERTSVLKTPATGKRSSLRRRNTVNYQLPSLNSKLRQGDPHTFGSGDLGGSDRTPRRRIP
jgi:hypothetical protein